MENNGNYAPLPDHLLKRANDNVAAMRADQESDWPDRLLSFMATMPLLTEEEVDEGRSAVIGGLALTRAELEVLRHLAHGLNETQVTQVMRKSRDSVKSFVRQAKAKLEALSTPHAVAIAIRRGLISPPPR